MIRSHPDTTLDKAPTQTKSFRLDADVLESLEIESARRGTSVNNLTNQILRKWVNFDRYLQDFGTLVLSVHDFLRAINSFDDETIRLLAVESGKRFPKDLILFTGQKNDLKTCIRFVETILCDYMRWANYHSTSGETEFVITLRHNYGSKWSVALEAMLTSMFQTNVSIIPRFTVTESTVLMTIPKVPEPKAEPTANIESIS
ncbi:MAG TPA: hypothetical protein VN739_01810 [Nitrososphaerales archaeon]|nr:hypothetical protein [Nitrososphaerales archaeon]